MEKYEITKDRDLLEQLHEIYKKEVEELKRTNNVTDKIIDLKGESLETLENVFRDLLDNDYCLNYSVILNLNLLVNGYNTLDDGMFESDEVWFTSIEQLIDIKIDLADVISKFQRNVTIWTLGLLKSAHKVEYVYLDQFKEIPNLYKRLLITTPLMSVSQCVFKTKNLNLDEVPLVKDAFPTFMEMCSTASLGYQMLQIFDPPKEK